MKKMITGGAALLGVILLVLFGVLIYFKREQTKLLSPILGLSRESFADNIWSPIEPKFNLANLFNNAPELTSQAAFFVDTQTGEVLFQKNAHQRLPIASLTKIMTVIVTLEKKSLADVIEISQTAAEIEPDKMLLRAGEKLTIEELLDGIFLISANDAAEALAEKVTGSREEFINFMNSKALQIGMSNTKFINPTGLDEDNQTQYSTVYDVALMARFAINKWPNLINITSNPHIYLEKTLTHQDYDMYSGINLLTTYPGVIGFKTGYTPEAGLTLVTLARRESHEVLGVLLGASDRRDDAKALLDYSFKKLGV